MTKIGKHIVFGHLLSGEKTQTELVELTGLKKGTISYHLKNLVNLKIITFEKTRKTYRIEIEQELKNEILLKLKKESSLHNLAKELRTKVKETGSIPALTELTKDKDFKIKLDDLLEYLKDEGLVVVSTSKPEEKWIISWLGCSNLNLCHFCKESIDDGHVVAQRLMVSGILDEWHTVLLHAKCRGKFEAEAYYEKYGNPIIVDDDCNYCGLELSVNNLRDQLKSRSNKSSRNGLKYIKSFLTNNEILTLESSDEYNTEKTNNIELREPSLRVIENIFDEIKGFSKSKKIDIDKNRIIQIFEKWQNRDESEHERINEYLKMLFENEPACLFYADSSASFPLDSSHEFLRFGSDAHLSASEFNFICKIGEKKYHPHCYKQVSKIAENKNVKGRKN